MSVPADTFDVLPERRGTNCYKWDRRPRNSTGRPLLPMWVADMDFACPPAVREALAARIAHPVYGYTFEPADHRRAFCDWQRERNGWRIEEEWLVQAPAVMPAVRAAILAFTEPGDEVVIQTPVYYPFFDAVRDNGRELVLNPLIEERHADASSPYGAHYSMDLDHLESVIGPRTRMLLLCSPHNPVGRVWSRRELGALAELCLRHDLTVVSDEIHCDLRRARASFTPFADLGPEVAARTVACHSASKTFNVAGIAAAHVVVPAAEVRARFSSTLGRLGMTLANILAMEASHAAYASSADWLDALTGYLDSQIAWLACELDRRFGSDRTVTISPIEGTYLAWLDLRAILRGTGTTHCEAERALLEEAALWLSDGRQFGDNGEGFFRMNLATSRATLCDGLSRLEEAIRFLERSG